MRSAGGGWCLCRTDATAILRRGWINLDLIWTIALVVTGLILLVA
jgi:hypothetical protein